MNSSQNNRSTKPRKKCSRRAKPPRAPKLGHVSISNEITMHRLWDIHPSPENDKLYKPIDPTDAEFLAFVEQVRVNGITDPLIITSDGYICSGHRRDAAAKAIGLKFVPCRTANICHDDPRFLRFLRDCNRQRVKSLDEILREEVVSADPAEAHRLLIKHRRESARVDVDSIVIREQKRRSEISSAKEPFLIAIEKVLEDRRDYWPLSDRQIHYPLLNDPPLIHANKPESTYRNDLKSYKALCELLTRARLSGRIPFCAIADPTRPVTTWSVFQNPQSFIRQQLNTVLKNYYRDLMQSQPNHIEIVGEKNTIDSIIRPVAMEFCIPYTIGRGYCSLPPRYEMAKRFQRSGKERMILLVLSDFDPEGEDIAHSFARSMRDDFGIRTIRAIKVALTSEQVGQLNLPPQMRAKRGSSRRKRFVDQHGENVWELEAAPPDELQRILRGSIDSIIDIKAFNAEVDAEKLDAAFLDGVRQRMLRAIGPMLDGGAE
jgi:hypothetical protein